MQEQVVLEQVLMQEQVKMQLILQPTGADADCFTGACADPGFSRGFGALETDFGMAFLTFGAETTLTFTLLLFSLVFVRKVSDVLVRNPAMPAGFSILVMPESPGCSAASGVVHNKLVSARHFNVYFPL